MVREGNSTLGPHLNSPEQMVWDRKTWKSTSLLSQHLLPVQSLQSTEGNWLCGSEVVGGGPVGRQLWEPSTAAAAGTLARLIRTSHRAPGPSPKLGSKYRTLSI